MDGVLVMTKPSGITSHDVVKQVRKILGVKKVGHTGTLDPLANGVLILCVERATRLTRFLQNDDKEYIAEMRLGLVTDSYDLTGKVLKKSKCRFSKSQIRETLLKFKGTITQIPPATSAIKVDGVPMYKLAREGKKIKPRPREVEIKEIELLKVRDNKSSSTTYDTAQAVVFRVVCSKGTYIRALCFAIGKALGCGACMSRLTRTRCGIFHLDQAITIKHLDKYRLENRLDKIFISMSEALKNYAAVVIKKESVPLVLNGALLRLSMVKEDQGDVRKGDIIRLLDSRGNLLAVARMVKKPSVFRAPGEVIARSLCVFPNF